MVINKANTRISSKGFALPLVLVVFCLVILGGLAGWFYLIHKGKLPSPEAPVTPSLTPVAIKPNVVLETGFSFYLPSSWTAKISDQSKTHFFGRFFLPNINKDTTYVEIESLASNKQVKNPLVVFEKTEDRKINGLQAALSEGKEKFGTSQRLIKQASFINKGNILTISLYYTALYKDSTDYDSLIRSVSGSMQSAGQGFRWMRPVYAAEAAKCQKDQDCSDIERCNLQTAQCDLPVCASVPVQACQTSRSRLHACPQIVNQTDGTSCLVGLNVDQKGVCEKGECVPCLDNSEDKCPTVECLSNDGCKPEEQCNLSNKKCEVPLCPTIPPSTEYSCETVISAPHTCPQPINKPDGMVCKSEGKTGACQDGACVVSAEKIAGIPVNNFTKIKVMSDSLSAKISQSDTKYKDGYAKFYSFEAFKGQRLTTAVKEDSNTNPGSFIKTELYNDKDQLLLGQDTRIEYTAPYTGSYYYVVRSFNNQEGGFLLRIFDRNQTDNLVYLKYGDGTEKLVDPTKTPPPYGEQEVAIEVQFTAPVDVVDDGHVSYFAKAKELEPGLGQITTPLEVYGKKLTYQDLLKNGSELPEEYAQNLLKTKITKLTPSKVLIEPAVGGFFPKNYHLVVVEQFSGRQRFFTENP